jgi:hypothetical protein
LITVNDVSVTEGNTGTVTATFAVKLSAAYGKAVSVHYATADGSATAAGGDYQAASGTLTFAPGETTKNVPVFVNGDRTVEPGENFSLVLTDPTDAFVGDGNGVGFIQDDEPHVSIDYGPALVTEGNAGSTTALFTVRLSAAYDVPVEVNFSTYEGDTDFPICGSYGCYDPPPAATAGGDFQAASGTVTFNPGDTVRTIPVVVDGDLLPELDEYFSVNLTGSTNSALDWTHAVGGILDDEPRASVGNTSSAVEGDTGTTAMTFMVTLSAPPVTAVTVSYETADGLATAGSDYQAAAGTVTFAPGETSKPVTVRVIGDRLGENEEYFTVRLTGATGAVVVTGIAYGTIVDNEPRLSITGGSVTEGNKGTKLLTFTVRLSAAYDQAVTVRYNTNDWSATAGEDYVATSGLLTFAAGQTAKTFTVTVKGDTKKEADERFFVSMTDASSNAVISYYEAGGNILNDDRGPKKPARGHGADVAVRSRVKSQKGWSARDF